MMKLGHQTHHALDTERLSIESPLGRQILNDLNDR